jgi:N-acetylglucosamine kinase-like BadF-type ATPase
MKSCHYYIGIDGGGTKTRGVLMSNKGEILKDILLGPSNYQLVGLEQFKTTLSSLLVQLFNTIDDYENTYVYLGLSGADTPTDFKILSTCIETILPHSSFTIENDTWSILKSGLIESFGAVSLYGTGANAGAINQKGEKHILRALSYLAGGFGGGDELANAALHYAFRGDEGTYKKTSLSQQIPLLLSLNAMEDLLPFVFPKLSIPTQLYKALTPLLFEQALLGDEVSIKILNDFGMTQGEMVLAVLKKANLLSSAVPIVVGGSVFKGSSHHFVTSMMNRIVKEAPLAYLKNPICPPVGGALLYAIEKSGSIIEDKHIDAIKSLR